MDLNEKQAQLVHRLLALPNGQDRLTYLLGVARDRPSLPPEDRLDSRLVPGCLAKLWFIPRFQDGLCFFDCDSDSLVVKAVAGLLCEFYSGQPPAEILSHDPKFLAPLGIDQHLTPNRRNALAKVWDYIQFYARANAS